MKSNNDYLKFYGRHRCRNSDLYPSEKEILANLDFRRKSVLDVGCASGGFYSIFKRIAPDVKYFGLDISQELISAAKDRFPEIAGNFYIGQGTGLPFKKNRFDVVFCSSVQAHCRQYQSLFLECWRVAKEYLIFDFRFSFAKKTRDLAKENSNVPYIVLNIKDVFDLINRLKGLKDVKMESYKIIPNRNNLKESKISRAIDVRCGLFLFKKGVNT